MYMPGGGVDGETQNVETLDCKFFHHGQKFKLLTPRRGRLKITTFQHILQDPRTQNIPLILGTPTHRQPKLVWAQEIEMLQALTNTPPAPAIKSEEDLEDLVRNLTTVVRKAKALAKQE